MAEAHHPARRAIDSGHARHRRPRRPARRLAEPGGAPRRRSWGGAIAWTLLGTVVPGLGLLRARRWLAGGFALGAFAAGLGVAAYLVLHRSLMADVTTLRLIGLGLVVVAALLTVIVVHTYRSLAPARLTLPQRALAGLVVAVFVFAATGPTLVAAQYAASTAELLAKVFTDGPTSVTVPTFEPGAGGDAWANKPRVNLLLLGYDRGIGRTEEDGGLTDTVMVASIDTKTGNTVLVSIPRETQGMPFPVNSPLHGEFPCGWSDCNTERNANWFINSMYLVLPTMVDPDIIGPTKDLGADALKLSVGEALGLSIDYYLLVNIDGATQLIDAVGGITVNVNKELPKEPIWLGTFEPGPNQHLGGDDALQYARSRHWDDDFQRNGRQRCVIKAVIDQADPATLLTRYEAIAAASADMIRTDIPATLIPGLFDLARRVKAQGTITGMGFVDGEFGFSQTDPDFGDMADRVMQAIAASVAPPSSATTTAPPAGDTTTEAPDASTEPVDASTSSPTATPDSSQEPPPLGADQNLDDFCAYHPEA